ncbi:LPXTG cell wall anchor domain-containing protein [Streptococcus macedonicus]|uniref:LPXTG cell wall anchor domain-containing protein n=1 Tax=Streptococcus macedonicus TaxID=59310 RepID=A0AA47FCX9_STRMC|nr:LPXTG cell wall anchor domain-containing protein [Streptococcus macedonicus]MCW8487053.1 LPXTG cell wall anchor domain-containing protein [Streptococcus macedonicus]MCW8495269.1 LPXTG cell wall anchor domain-containing protein [Streptococcus macedonicus]MCW8500531.1 LPXTG cell wall anchor domain-containing protein [Streptococcus macedonicus]MCW8502573.1 LPXTG cell wall anchor domain-containing protein [Streptococcus macedonicus]MCW8504672.1 LPXTG cell wall anchor domain-containing protein [
MKKVKALALFSTAILATASTGVYADEVISDGTTSPSTELVEPTPAPSSGVVTPSDDSNTSSSSSEATEPETPGANESIPGISEDEPSNPASEITEPETPGVNESIPGISEDEPSNPDSEITEPETPSTETTEQPGEVEVPTTNGGKATVVPDTSVPTNNPNITAETAQNAGASQVGTTSTVTGQVVRDVTRSNPVTLYNGASLVDIRDGLVTLSTGEKVAPEVVGVKANADGTYTAKTIQGDTVTLPHTGEKNSTVLSVVGALILSVLGFGLKKRKNQEI